MRRYGAVMAGLALGAFLVVGTGAQAAAGERSYWSQAGLGLGSVLANAVYMPAKVTYAALGTVTGALTYALTGGSYETAENVWLASLGGSYVVTPGMLTGEEPVELSGTPTIRTASLVDDPAALQDTRVPPVSDGYARDSLY